MLVDLSQSFHQLKGSSKATGSSVCCQHSKHSRYFTLCGCCPVQVLKPDLAGISSAMRIAATLNLSQQLWWYGSYHSWSSEVTSCYQGILGTQRWLVPLIPTVEVTVADLIYRTLIANWDREGGVGSNAGFSAMWSQPPGV